MVWELEWRGGRRRLPFILILASSTLFLLLFGMYMFKKKPCVGKCCHQPATKGLFRLTMKGFASPLFIQVRVTTTVKTSGLLLKMNLWLNFPQDFIVTLVFLHLLKSLNFQKPREKKSNFEIHLCEINNNPHLNWY